MKKWLIPLLYILMTSVAFFYRNEIQIWLEHRPSLITALTLATLLALFPVMPYKLIIAGIGLIYGAWTGAIITIIGSTLSGIILYATGAIWYRKELEKWLERYPRLYPLHAYVSQHPFESIVLYRLLPIIPQWIINLYAGMASIPFHLYLTGSLIGKFPGILVYAFLGSSIFSSPLLAVKIYGAYMLFLLAGLWGFKRKSLRKPG